MSRRDWKRLRAHSLVHALRLCKEFAQERHNLSVERIADRMGVTHDCLYKWLATGRLPAIQLPTFELACGCNYASAWLAATAGKVVIDLPKGTKAHETDLVEFNTGFAEALQLLNDFHSGTADAQATLQALQRHLEQAAWHHANVAKNATPELDFES
ncbi:Uncharacterised protein [Comamonas aquatica]|uniref:hypothetical protein n=1 Tax=Comamonas aquatica TaxID=225991 RepID=UPI001EF1BB62|nr:hypothetical protein [Comamonas aquatica]CAB5646351.1 Uncharacterised protein [Comamonas aquatica]CAC9169280.1 Uncharacterised protein [Comamonas aquatica]